MRKEHMCYRLINDRLNKAGKTTPTPEHDKLLAYLFFCLAYGLQQDRDRIKYQDAQWSDPDTTFSMVLYHSGGETHDYCCSCIETLGGSWRRECGPVTTVYTKSQTERDELKSSFISLLNHAQEQLSGFYDKSPQEYFFLKTNPIIKEVFSTDNNHIVALTADIQDAVDKLCIEETMQKWADYERIRDYFEIVVEADSAAQIRVVFYRIRKQRKLVRYLKNLGL